VRLPTPRYSIRSSSSQRRRRPEYQSLARSPITHDDANTGTNSVQTIPVSYAKDRRYNN
jgi:hypothetical protein